MRNESITTRLWLEINRDEIAEVLGEALTELMTIARYYHKGEAPGHLDACENPDGCGHCLAMRKANAALDRAVTA